MQTAGTCISLFFRHFGMENSDKTQPMKRVVVSLLSGSDCSQLPFESTDYQSCMKSMTPISLQLKVS